MVHSLLAMEYEYAGEPVYRVAEGMGLRLLMYAPTTPEEPSVHPGDVAALWRTPSGRVVERLYGPTGGVRMTMAATSPRKVGSSQGSAKTRSPAVTRQLSAASRFGSTPWPR